MRHTHTFEVVRQKLSGSRRAASSRVRTRPKRRALLLTASLLSMLVCALCAFAQTPTPAAAPAEAQAGTPRTSTATGEAPNPATTTAAAGGATAATTGAPAPAPTPRPEVIDVYNIYEANNSNAFKRTEAGLGDIIIVKVSGLRELLHRAKCATDDPQNPPPPTCRPQDLLLYLDGRPLKGLLPESGAPKPEEGTLRFHLQRPGESAPTQYAADTDEHWADLLGLSLDDLSLHRDVSVSVGLENEYPIDTRVKNFHLLRMRSGRLYFWSIFFALCLIALVHFARQSDLLRDRKPVLWKQRKPYSLSLSQAAWWFVLTAVSFVFIWMVTGQYDLSSSVLVLLGIGFGTALGAAVIDQNKGARPATAAALPGSNELDTLLAKKHEQEARLSVLESNLRDAAPGAARDAAQAALAAQQSAYDLLTAEIKQKYPGSIGSGHINFARDILSDANGISFHRFQMLVWTVVLGFIFIHSVFTRLAMPQFSTTLLSLMGISAGAYLGGKGTEGNEAITGVQPATPAPGGGGGASDAPGGGTTATNTSATSAAGAADADTANADTNGAETADASTASATAADADTSTDDDVNTARGGSDT